MSFEEDDVDFSGPTHGLTAVLGGSARPPPASMSSANQAANSNSAAAAALLAQAKPMAAMAVDAFRFVGDQYQSQGKVGISLLGVAPSRQYLIILYKQGASGEKLPLTLTMVGEKFKFIVRADNYGSFYDETGCNWAARFDSPDSLANFCLQVAVARTLSNPKQLMVIQDVLPGAEGAETISDGWKVECNYTPFVIASNGTSPVTTGQQVVKHKLKASASKAGLSQLIVGMAFPGGRRIGIQLQPDGNFVAYDIALLRAKAPSAAASDAVSVDLDSSHSSGRGGILSRMARLGQHVLPGPEMQAETDAGAEFSDAESVSVPSSTPSKQRRNKVAAESQAQQFAANRVHTSVPATPGVTMVMGQTGVPIPTLMPQTALATKNQIAVYQSPMSQQQQYIQQDVSSPQPSVDSQKPEWSVLFMETRQNSTEMRVVLSKVQDKLDAINQRLDQQFQQNQQAMASSDVAGGILDGRSVLGALQRMVAEEERLREELKARQDKIEQLNLRVSELLIDKQKLIESSNRALSDRSDALSATAAQSTGRVLQLEEEKASLALRVSTLTAEVGDLHLVVAEKRRSELELRNELIAMKETVTAATKAAEDANEAVKQMEAQMVSSRDQETIAQGELSTEKRRVGILQSELADTKKQLENAHAALSLKDSSLTEALSKASEAQSESTARIHLLEQEVDRLRNELQTSRSNGDRLGDQLRTKMSENQELIQQRDHLNSELRAKTNDIQTLSIQVTELNRLRDSLEARLADCEVKLNDEQKRYQALASSASSADEVSATVTQQVKSIMNQVYQSSRSAIASDGEFYGDEILRTLLAVIKQTTLNFLSGDKSGPVIVQPATPIDRPIVNSKAEPEVPSVQPVTEEEQHTVVAESTENAQLTEVVPETNDEHTPIDEVVQDDFNNQEDESPDEPGTQEPFALIEHAQPQLSDDYPAESPPNFQDQPESSEKADSIPLDEDTSDYPRGVAPVFITPDDATEESEIVPVHRDHVVPEDSQGQIMNLEVSDAPLQPPVIDENELYATAPVPAEDQVNIENQISLETPEPSPAETSLKEEELQDELQEELVEEPIQNDVLNGLNTSDENASQEIDENAPTGIQQEIANLVLQQPIDQHDASSASSEPGEVAGVVSELDSAVVPEDPILSRNSKGGEEAAPKKSSLFGDDSDSDMEDLFSSKPPPTPSASADNLPSQENQSSLFEQAKEDDDIRQEETEESKKQQPPVPATRGGALFGDDDDDDDDWFGSK